MTRLEKLRKKYIAYPTRAGLRLYLIYKARRGKYDKRMFRYYGVPPISDRHLKTAVVRAYAMGLVPTATTNGKHSPTSYHRLGKAVDFGLIERHIGTKYGLNKLKDFQRGEYVHYKSHGMVEVIGPVNNWCVLRGRKVTLQEGTLLEDMHDNHVHEAVL